MTAILMAEEYWANNHLSIVRSYGGVQMNGVEYIIVNKEGKDIFECSMEAEKAGREKAIEPGEPCDLIDRRFQKDYRRLGRDRFIRELEANPRMNADEFLKYLKTVKKTQQRMKR